MSFGTDPKPSAPDICNKLEDDAEWIECLGRFEAKAIAARLRKAAATIRRLRAEVTAEHVGYAVARLQRGALVDLVYRPSNLDRENADELLDIVSFSTSQFAHVICAIVPIEQGAEP